MGGIWKIERERERGWEIRENERWGRIREDERWGRMRDEGGWEIRMRNEGGWEMKEDEGWGRMRDKERRKGRRVCDEARAREDEKDRARRRKEKEGSDRLVITADKSTRWRRWPLNTCQVCGDNYSITGRLVVEITRNTTILWTSPTSRAHCHLK